MIYRSERQNKKNSWWNPKLPTLEKLAYIERT